MVLWLLFVYRGVKIFSEGWHSQALYTKGLANTMAMVQAAALVCAFNLQFLAALLARALARSDGDRAQESEQEPRRR